MCLDMASCTQAMAHVTAIPWDGSPQAACTTRTRLCSLAEHSSQQAIALAGCIAVRTWWTQGLTFQVHNGRRYEITLAIPGLASHRRLASIFVISGVEIEAHIGLQF